MLHQNTNIINRYKGMNLYLSFLVLLLCFSFSCKQVEEYPIVPIIKFESFNMIDNGLSYDTKGTLTISFTDGDGDIGLSQEDTIGDYEYNFYIYHYQKINGEYKTVLNNERLPITHHSRIPVITPNGNNKSIKGFVEVDLYINNIVDNSNNKDTVRLTLHILDRALHKSNIITTPDIIVNKR